MLEVAPGPEPDQDRLKRQPAPARLHGRGGVQLRIDLLIGAARLGRGGALLLRGDVGTGKSALLDYALDRASDMLVLPCQGDEAESGLPFAALHQLIQPVLGLVDELPRPLAAALETAASGSAPDGHGVGAAALALLTVAARQRPLVCLVDDGQWLDRPSADALRSAVPRLRHAGAALLVAVTDGEGPFPPAALPEMRLDGLDPGPAASALAELAGPHLASEVARRLVERTGGHPGALADLAGGLTPAQLAGHAALPDPLPLAPRLRAALLRRLGGLPDPVRRLLLVVAAAEAGTVDALLAAAAELGIERSALGQAEAAGFVRTERGVVRFRSPLLSTAVHGEATFLVRRGVHLALARAAGEDEDARVRHLAAAALGPDGGVAAELERSAERAGFRGDPGARADALRRAARFTPDAPERARRLTAAARACWLAGRTTQAAELLDRAERLRPAPLLGADIAELQGAIAFRGYRLDGARESLLAGAARAAVVSSDRALQLLVRAARVAVVGGDAGSAEEVARRALALAPGGRHRADLVAAIPAVLGGRLEEAARLAERAIAIAPAAGSRGGHLLNLAVALSAGNDLSPAALASARDALAAQASRLRALGMVAALPIALASLAWLELWYDRHRQALAAATEGLSLSRGLGQAWTEASCAATLAVLAAIRGHEDELASVVHLLQHPPGAESAAGHEGAAAWATALADLGARRFAEAHAGLAELAPGRRLGLPWLALWSRPDAVEAGVRSGRLGSARAALAVLERAARPDWPAPAAALLARSRALLAEGPEAERHYLSALSLHAGDARPFQEARTRLLWAEHLRRNRRRLDAREQLRAALATFERLEARPWVARAQSELRATGETARRRDSGVARLTPQELRIAELVAGGASNREVAERLFISPRTVGHHLGRIYAKLEVSSRTRLALLLREDGLEDAAEIEGRPRRGLSGRARSAFRSRSAVEADPGAGLPAMLAEEDRVDATGPRAS